jgi:hypothetical protein
MSNPHSRALHGLGLGTRVGVAAAAALGLAAGGCNPGKSANPEPTPDPTAAELLTYTPEVTPSPEATSTPETAARMPLTAGDVENLADPFLLEINPETQKLNYPPAAQNDAQFQKELDLYYAGAKESTPGVQVYYTSDGSGNWQLLCVGIDGEGQKYIMQQLVSYANGPYQIFDYQQTFNPSTGKVDDNGKYIKIPAPGDVAMAWKDGWPYIVANKVTVGDKTYYTDCNGPQKLDSTLRGRVRFRKEDPNDKAKAIYNRVQSKSCDRTDLWAKRIDAGQPGIRDQRQRIIALEARIYGACAAAI